MAASPVIIDDGGSTRIKQFGALNTHLDRLLEKPNADIADGTFPPNIGGGVSAKCVVTVVTIDKDGVPTKTTLFPAGAPLQFGGGETAEIKSDLGQTVEIKLGANGVLQIDLNGPPGVDPIVESRQIDKQRRYIVINAGLIQQVRVKSQDVFPGGIHNSIYTFVRLG